MTEITLDKLPIGKTAKIKEISINCKCRNRLIDIGFVPESTITHLFRSPLNSPVAYLINGTVIALRNEEAENIKVIII